LKVTSDAARDLAAGRNNPIFFAKRWLGIELHPGQERWVNGIAARDDSGWRPKYLTTVCSAGNRAGKTLGMAVAVFHSAFYKLGVQPPDGTQKDAMRWQNAPYEWYHVGIQQETAELVHREIAMVLEGSHPAQKGRGCPIVDEIGKVVEHTKKYRGEYLWLQFHPLIGGANIHFRTTQEKAKALLGKDMNGISFDEAAFEPHLIQIYQEVLNLRRLSTGGQLHFIGTPTEGINDYADLWEMGNEANPDRDPQFFSFRLSTRDNVGYGLATDTFDAILRQQAEYLIPQNIDGYFIEASDSYFSSASVDGCFVDTLPAEQMPENKRRYIQGCDPGIMSDSTWAITLDSTDRNGIIGVRARTRTGKQTIQAVVNMVREGHLLYNQQSSCVTVVDETGFGGKLFKQEFSVIKPLRGYDFGGTKAKKLELLSDLKAAMDKNMIKFPRSGIWMQLRRQLLSYKLDDKKLEQDAVMALAVAVRYALRHGSGYVENPVFTYFGGSD
jgi:hypothetical protein